MVFEGYSIGLGFPLCGGGRYDHLLTEYGNPMPATGFALGMERILLALMRQGGQIPPASKHVYVGYTDASINEAIRLIEKPLRQRYRTSTYKTHYYGSGLLRMVMADPSEAVDSASILPALHAFYDTIEERPFGGNILPYALKDLAFHFVRPDERATETLHRLFRFEDEYIRTHQSDYVFGLYRPKRG